MDLLKQNTDVFKGKSLKTMSTASRTTQINAQTITADTEYLSNYTVKLHLEALR